MAPQLPSCAETGSQSHLETLTAALLPELPIHAGRQLCPNPYDAAGLPPSPAPALACPRPQPSLPAPHSTPPSHSLVPEVSSSAAAHSEFHDMQSLGGLSGGCCTSESPGLPDQACSKSLRPCSTQGLTGTGACLSLQRESGSVGLRQPLMCWGLFSHIFSHVLDPHSALDLDRSDGRASLVLRRQEVLQATVKLPTDESRNMARNLSYLSSLVCQMV